MDVRMWFSICFIPYHMQDAATVREKVLFANAISIMEVDVDTKDVAVLIGHGDSHGVLSLDYDSQNKYVYFPRYNAMDIVRFPYPSPSRTLEHVVNTSANPVGVAVDSSNDHVYWVTPYYYSDSNKVSRCKSDGTNVVVFTSLNQYTFMIRLDLTNSWMYLGYYTTGISKSRFDLTDISMIKNFTYGGFSHVSSMDIDLSEQRLYWMTYYDGIQSVNVDGSNVTTIISINSQTALGVIGNYIYYTGNNNQLLMTRKSQGSTPTVLYNDTSYIRGIYGFYLTGM
ncbi:low-density lipoprotein receptor-related protein 1B-like [Mytilus californianus]|uniref:low-density lipoprotein receptor-related protein 1B-like n=1 Tax=Mytilus californianus TaxID=6549 RepID=UPI002248210B|nr:low-density lipoprotein receptor-related protein 1B-like [Mytilus californianus]